MQIGVVVTLTAPLAAGLGGQGVAVLAALWGAYAAAKLVGQPWLLRRGAAELVPLAAGIAVVVVALWALGLGFRS